jgi:hypothetical protein
MQTFVSCPDCTAPAEIIERFSLASTDGRVDHIVLFCAGGHHFRMAADMLPVPQPAWPGRAGAAVHRRYASGRDCAS